MGDTTFSAVFRRERDAEDARERVVREVNPREIAIDPWLAPPGEEKEGQRGFLLHGRCDSGSDALWARGFLEGFLVARTGRIIPRGIFAAGLLIVAADAVERANKKIVDNASPLLVLEDVLESMAAVIEETAAMQADVAEFIIDETGHRPIDDPERLRDLLARTLRRRRFTRE